MKRPSGIARPTAAVKAMPERCRLMAMSSSSAPPDSPCHNADRIASRGGKTVGLIQPWVEPICQTTRNPVSRP